MTFSLLGSPLLGTILGVLTGAVLRTVAVWRGWNLPNGLQWQPRALFGEIYRRRRRRHPG